MANQSPDSLGGQETFTGPLEKPTGPLSLGDALFTVRNTIGMSFKLIPAGEFMMGSPESEEGRYDDDDEAQRAVKIPSAFSIGVYQVTQSEYESVIGSNPSRFKGDNKPVDSVSFDDVVAFCEKLSSLPAEVAAGRVYRLPTEAEWEYACRAGTTTAYNFGDDAQGLGKYAWFGDNSGNATIDIMALVKVAIESDDIAGYLAKLHANGCTTHGVGEKLPNEWGLYDMHGNVWEWCSDSILDVDDDVGGSFRVLRGGCWGLDAASCRSASRDMFDPTDRAYGGFRLALSPSGQ